MARWLFFIGVIGIGVMGAGLLVGCPGSTKIPRDGRAGSWDASSVSDRSTSSRDWPVSLADTGSSPGQDGSTVCPDGCDCDARDTDTCLFMCGERMITCRGEGTAWHCACLKMGCTSTHSVTLTGTPFDLCLATYNDTGCCP